MMGRDLGVLPEWVRGLRRDCIAACEADQYRVIGLLRDLARVDPRAVAAVRLVEIGRLKVAAVALRMHEDADAAEGVG